MGERVCLGECVANEHVVILSFILLSVFVLAWNFVMKTKNYKYQSQDYC